MNINVLITGNPGKHIWEAAEQLKKHKLSVTVAASGIEPRAEAWKKKYYELSENAETLPSVYRAGDFEAVIFIMSCQNLNGDAGEEGSVYGHQLDLFMKNLAQLDLFTDVKRLILVDDSRVFGAHQNKSESTNPSPDCYAGRIMKLAEQELANYQRADVPIEKTLVRTTHVYGTESDDAFADSFPRSYETISLPGKLQDKCNLISAPEFGDLLFETVISDWHGIVHGVNGVYTDKETIARFLSDCEMKTIFSDTESYGTFLHGDEAALHLDWVCNSDFMAQIRRGKREKAKKEQSKNLVQSVKEKLGAFAAPLETAAGALLMQLLVRLTNTYTTFSIVDVRLLFTVFIGSVHGAFWGCIAGLIAYVSYAVAFVMTKGSLWDLLLNMDNWLPLVLYMLGGEITGYIKTGADNKEKELTTEIKNRDEELAFLRMLHRSTCTQRDILKEQVVKTKGSYGKVYRMTGELDTLQPDEINFRAVRMLEDVLECNSVSIYYRERNNRYIRKIAESSENSLLNQPYSLNLDEYPLMKADLESDRMFINKSLMVDYPAYCLSHRVNATITVVVILWKVEYKQFTKYYQNLLTNTVSLISRFFNKAIEFQNKPERYIEGTRILKPDDFMQAWQVRRQIKMEQMGQYVLFMVSASLPDDVLNERLMPIIRSLDVIGKAKDGTRFLIMMQADESAVPQLEKRFLSHGVYATHVTDDKLNVYLE